MEIDVSSLSQEQFKKEAIVFCEDFANDQICRKNRRYLKINKILNFSMSPNSYQSLNGATSCSRGSREEVKKGKSSKFNPKNYEHVKKSPPLKAWSHEGSNSYPKMVKNGSIGLKQGCYTRLKKKFQGQTKLFPQSTSHNYPRSIEKSYLSHQVWPHKRFTFFPFGRN